MRRCPLAMQEFRFAFSKQNKSAAFTELTLFVLSLFTSQPQQLQLQQVLKYQRVDRRAMSISLRHWCEATPLLLCYENPTRTRVHGDRWLALCLGAMAGAGSRCRTVSGAEVSLKTQLESFYFNRGKCLRSFVLSTWWYPKRREEETIMRINRTDKAYSLNILVSRDQLTTNKRRMRKKHQQETQTRSFFPSTCASDKYEMFFIFSHSIIELKY